MDEFVWPEWAGTRDRATFVDLALVAIREKNEAALTAELVEWIEAGNPVPPYGRGNTP